VGKKSEKKPCKPNGFLTALIKTFAFPRYLRGRNLSVGRIGTEGLKPPFLLLPSRGSALDYVVAVRAVQPYKIHVVLPSDLIASPLHPLARKLGIVFGGENTARALKYCTEEYKNAVALFPGRTRSFDGKATFISKDAARLAKELNVPVVVLRMNGNYLSSPCWNGEDNRVPLYAELIKVADGEEIKNISVDELHKKIKEQIATDDYAYQLRRGIETAGDRQANGLHRILYRCPHCRAEFMTYSEDARIWCASCGRGYKMTAFGELVAEEGETVFSSVPQWTEWERHLVEHELGGDDYRFGSEVFVRTSSGGKKFSPKRKGILTQTKDGTALEFTDTKERVEWTNKELGGVAFAYDYKKRKSAKSWGDLACFPKGDQRYFVFFTERDRLTKFAFAAEILSAAAEEN